MRSIWWGIMLCTLAATGCGDTDHDRSPPAADASAEASVAAANGDDPARPALNDPAIAGVAKAISGEEIRATIAEIASDAYGGRGPGSEGDEKTRRYLAEQLAAAGYEPAAPGGGWQQPFDLISVDTGQPAQWVFANGDKALTLNQHTQYIVNSGVQRPRSEVQDAELVFVGYGIEAPEYDWDDFKGADLRGKVLVMLNNDPDWDENLFEGNRRLYYGRWTYKYESAARQGAAGAIIIHTTPSAGYPWQVLQTSGTGPQFELPASGEARMQFTAWVTEPAASELMTLGGHSLGELVAAARERDFAPVSLGVSTSIELDNTIGRTRSANVIGRLPGSDPALADEAVIYTAHHDHLGIGRPNFAGDAADLIYNGARDNASGTAMVLAIARAFARLPKAPRRSVIVAFVGAEEQGLLGSKYLGQNPPIPAGRLAANINFDSGNIWGPTQDITYIGMGKSTLDEVAITVADFYGRIVKPDQFPDLGSFYRSDQVNLARIGVPALYLKGGTEYIGRPPDWGRETINAYTAQHYHQPSDELTDDWNFDGLRNDAEFGFWAGYLIAAADEMPSWNEGDEFEAARKAALAALP